VDFADFHQYYQPDEAGFGDTAQATYDASMQIGASRPSGAGKPVIRGEVGFAGPEGPTRLFNYDSQGLWLHNFIWGGINPGGLIESYWYDNRHIYGEGEGRPAFDHRPLYRAYYNFISGLPLNNGHYQDANPQVSGEGLRAWGQKDLANGRAHLWIQNQRHSWLNVINEVAPVSARGSVTLAGFQPGKPYRLEWWDPYQAEPGRQVLASQVLAADETGNLSITISNLTADIAVKVTRWAWKVERLFHRARIRR
jgi:hypothetical protein